MFFLGEEAHWTPFQIASVDYILKTYQTWSTDGRDSDGAGLVAFTLGITSHYITDINWHGLDVIPSGEGLIRTMGELIHSFFLLFLSSPSNTTITTTRIC